MSTEDEDLTLVESSSRVCSWWWGTDGRVLIGKVVFLTANSDPFKVLGGQEPTVIKSSLGVVMTTEYKDSVVLWGRKCDMLCSSHWQLISLGTLLFPGAVTACKKLKLDLQPYLNFEILVTYKF